MWLEAQYYLGLATIFVGQLMQDLGQSSVAAAWLSPWGEYFEDWGTQAVMPAHTLSS